jgi:predicted dehydrogenase
MSHSAADGYDMLAAAQKSGRLVQIDAQRTSSVLCAKAKDLVAKGLLGEITLVEGSLGRNDPTGAWQYPPPPDLSPANLDWDTWQGDVPKRAFDPKIFARWRCWKEYGTGLAGDLMVHLISGMLYTWGLNEAPRRAQATGGILR